jgi:GNAT superfamily N-acetyltransferase
VSPPRPLLDLAEHSNAYTPLTLGERRVEDARFVVWLGPSPSPWSTVVQRLRLGSEVELEVAEIRDLLARLGRPGRCQWEVSHSATPGDLHERLLGLGFEPDPEPYVVGMVLATEPPPAPAGVRVRRVETPQEFALSQEIARTAFGVPEERRAELRSGDAQAFARLAASPCADVFLAEVDGVPVASGRATYAAAGVVLNSGATLPGARGRGAYRALVRARWEAGSRRGTPALVTQAGAQSRPILRRLGFVEVATLRVLLDAAAPAPAPARGARSAGR